LRPSVFIPERIGFAGYQKLAAECNCLAPWLEGSNADPVRALEMADAIVVRIFRVGAPELSAAARLRVIAKHGVGLDNIDVPAATLRRIPVVFTPGTNANAVAEHTLALMLALTRQIVPADRAVREGWIVERTQFQGIELAGKTLSIIGLGRIGKRVTLKAAYGLGMRVLAYDPYIDQADYPGPAELVSTIEQVIREADFVSLHVPLTDETQNCIGGRELSWAKPGCRLINTSRGAVVDEHALATALNGGGLAGAAVDVFETEPLPINHPLLAAPNVLLTPHIAGQSTAAMEATSLAVAEGVLCVLAGRKPPHLANPEVWQSQ
jgi:D-3-phosphoglycerate dehydrogenase